MALSSRLARPGFPKQSEGVAGRELEGGAIHQRTLTREHTELVDGQPAHDAASSFLSNASATTTATSSATGAPSSHGASW